MRPGIEPGKEEEDEDRAGGGGGGGRMRRKRRGGAIRATGVSRATFGVIESFVGTTKPYI